MRSARRTFLKTSLAAGAALTVPYIVRAAESRTYRTVLIGSGWWGMNICRAAIESGRCKIAALCDVDTNQIEPAAKEIEQLTGSAPKRYDDFREILDKEKPDIAIVATPDHWHPLITIAAVKAGADVYVEKPIAHTILEGRAMLKAARNAGRIVQVGLHRRVSPHNVSGMKFLKEGGAGQIGMVRAFVHSGGRPGGAKPDEDIPKGLNWDMWCGPAPYRPFNPAIHPKGFRQWLDYANGTLGDWGVHWMDQILWWTDERVPKSVHSTGGQFIQPEGPDAPDTQTVNYQFETFTAEWEHRRYGGNNAEKHPLGCYFYGTEGTFHMGWRDGWTFYPSNSNKPILHEEPQLNQPDNQNIRELFADFLASIESRRLPACDIENGYHATNLSLLGMLSLKICRSVAWDEKKGIIKNDPEATALLKRAYRGEWEYPDYA